LKGGRILWLVEPDSEVFKRLASVYRLNGGRYVFYTDITDDTPSVTLNGIEIIPNGIQ
jgi:hypothetical protein